MDEPICALADDLDQKFKELCSIQNLPELYLSDYFSEMRHRIDIDAERKLAELDTRNSDLTDSSDSGSWETQEEPEVDRARVNSLREYYIYILRKMEDEFLRGLSLPTASDSSEIYDDIGKRIDEFRKSLNWDGDLEGQKSVYLHLANEIFDKSSQLESKIFGDQTIGYVNFRRKPGHLVYVERGNLKKSELEAFCYLREISQAPDYYNISLHNVHLVSSTGDFIDSDF